MGDLDIFTRLHPLLTDFLSRQTSLLMSKAELSKFISGTISTKSHPLKSISAGVLEVSASVVGASLITIVRNVMAGAHARAILKNS